MKTFNMITNGNKMRNLVMEYFDNPSITIMANVAYKVSSNPNSQSLNPNLICIKARQIINKKWRPSYLSLFKKTAPLPQCTVINTYYIICISIQFGKISSLLVNNNESGNNFGLSIKAFFFVLLA